MIFGNDHRDKTAYPGPIADFPVPLAPDYGRPETWAAHPEFRPLQAWPAKVGVVPSAPGSQAMPVHTVFIHPTTFRGLEVECGLGRSGHRGDHR